jgi:hypothetical protein
MIDGSDLLKITANKATWTNRAWNAPDVVKLNDLSWNLRETNVWSNTGTNRFLPSGVDFSTAKIVRRQGRDLATMWADADAMWVSFADNPNGADAYELEISFGPESPDGRPENSFDRDRGRPATQHPPAESHHAGPHPQPAAPAPAGR